MSYTYSESWGCALSHGPILDSSYYFKLLSNLRLILPWFWNFCLWFQHLSGHKYYNSLVLCHKAWAAVCHSGRVLQLLFSSWLKKQKFTHVEWVGIGWKLFLIRISHLLSLIIFCRDQQCLQRNMDVGWKPQVVKPFPLRKLCVNKCLPN